MLDARAWSASAILAEAPRATGIIRPTCRHSYRIVASLVSDGIARFIILQRRKILYQGFPLLTANKAILQLFSLADLAALPNATPAQVVFRFARAVGIPR